MNNQHISDRIKRLANMMSLLDENPHKIRTFANAARLIDAHPEEMATLIDEDRLKNLDGIGDTLAHLILHYAKSGGAGLEQELEHRLPEGLVDLLDLPGLGLNKVQALWREHQISDLEQLTSACHKGELAKMKGFGSKSEAQLLSAIAFKTHHAADFHLDLALKNAESWLHQIKVLKCVSKAELSGQIRRGNNLINTIDILVAADPDELVKELKGGKPLDGGSGLELADPSGMPIHLWCVPESEFYQQQLLRTGGDAYLPQVEDALSKLFTNWSGATDEEAVCTKLGIQWIEPELRDSFSSFPVDRRLVETGDLKGIFHAHSTWSDGRNSLEEMVLAAMERGYQYFGISEHSQAAYYANGLQPDRVQAQWDEIDELNAKYPDIHIFKGIEADILSDGSLDYDETLLAGFDFVIASIHSHFHLDPVTQTDRIIRALQSPFTTMLGHPTGRMLLAREGYAPDLPAIIDAAAEYDKVIEINTTPKRLDLDWRHLRLALEKGVKVSLNPDAHRVTSIDTIPMGVMMARKGGLEAKDVLNTMTLNEIRKYFTRGKTA